MPLNNLPNPDNNNSTDNNNVLDEDQIDPVSTNVDSNNKRNRVDSPSAKGKNNKRKKINIASDKTSESKNIIHLRSFGDFIFDENHNVYLCFGKGDDLSRLNVLCQKYNRFIKEIIPISQHGKIFTVNSIEKKLQVTKQAMETILEYINKQDENETYAQWVFSENKDGDYLYFPPWGISARDMIPKAKRKTNSEISFLTDRFFIKKEGEVYMKLAIIISKEGLKKWQELMQLMPVILPLEIQMKRRGFILIENEHYVNANSESKTSITDSKNNQSMLHVDNLMNNSESLSDENLELTAEEQDLTDKVQEKLTDNSLNNNNGYPSNPDTVALDKEIHLMNYGTFNLDEKSGVYFSRNKFKKLSNLKTTALRYNAYLKEIIPRSQCKKMFVINSDTKLELSKLDMITILEYTKRKEDKETFDKWIFSSTKDGHYLYLPPWGHIATFLIISIQRKYPIAFTTERLFIKKDDEVYVKSAIKISKVDLQKWKELVYASPKIMPLETQAAQRGYIILEDENLVNDNSESKPSISETNSYQGVLYADDVLKNPEFLSDEKQDLTDEDQDESTDNSLNNNNSYPSNSDTTALDKKINLTNYGTFYLDEKRDVYFSPKEFKNLMILKRTSWRYNTLLKEIIPRSQCKSMFTYSDTKLEISKLDMSTILKYIKRKDDKDTFDKWILSSNKDGDYLYLPPWGRYASYIIKSFRLTHRMALLTERLFIKKDDEVYLKNAVKISKVNFENWKELVHATPEILPLETQAARRGYTILENCNLAKDNPEFLADENLEQTAEEQNLTNEDQELLISQSLNNNMTSYPFRSYTAMITDPDDPISNCSTNILPTTNDLLSNNTSDNNNLTSFASIQLQLGARDQNEDIHEPQLQEYPQNNYFSAPVKLFEVRQGFLCYAGGPEQLSDEELTNNGLEDCVINSGF